MSKAQLHGVVGYTGYIRPSLQCTQLSSLKPGQHSHQAGSYIPPGLNLEEPCKPKSLPTSMMKSQSDDLDGDAYATFSRQDRTFLANSRAMPDRDPVSVSHWVSMHKSTFTEKSPDRHFQMSFRPENQPVLPSPPRQGHDTHKAHSFKDMVTAAQTQEVMGKKKPRMMSTIRTPRGAGGDLPEAAELAASMNEMSMTWPRKGSREQITHHPNIELRQQHFGTTKASNHPPGYMGYIPHPAAGLRAHEHGSAVNPRATQRCKEDTLFDSFLQKPVGYLGYAPTSVYNRRKWDLPTETTNGANDLSMVSMGHIPKRPEAGGTSTLLDESFSGPLDGRPSDNGVFNSQIYFKLLRPLEGAARGHVPSATHPTGRKFLKPHLTMKNF